MQGELRAATVIDGVPYQNANQVAAECGVSRQTLWRWRREGTVPLGRLYRGRLVVYRSDEIATIRAYAHRLVSLDKTEDTNRREDGEAE